MLAAVLSKAVTLYIYISSLPSITVLCSSDCLVYIVGNKTFFVHKSLTSV